MPSFATHHIFAATVQRVTGDSVVAHRRQSILRATAGARRVPSRLRFTACPSPAICTALRHRMRAEAPGALFEALCAAAEQEHNTAALAYVFGFCTNYALDRVTRPFIRAQADRPCAV